ncbi:hypothetical protein B0H14DRAFT_2626145 [Mycena olivaceomarginata]|nr:hypothetical protein B0H14DRAFT_2626145 [Mycena olivaceomarginata]
MKMEQQLELNYLENQVGAEKVREYSWMGKIRDRTITLPSETKVRGSDEAPSATFQDRHRRRVDRIWQALSGWVILGQAGTFFVSSINFNAFEGHRGALVGKGGKNMFENKI